MPEAFYVTTPIYYPNAEPHLGHVYTTIACDVLTRYHKLRGDATFFLTGTDEHGIKMVKTAAQEGIAPQVLADRYSGVFEALWKELRIGNDDFIRTTQPRHKDAVQKIVRCLVASDDIYLGHYEGWYDEGQEEFVTETDAKANAYKSAISGRPLTRYQEPTYFFRLGKYVDRLLQHIEEHKDFIQPESRRNEVVSKLKAGVGDLSISRATLKWGIPLPHDPEHVVYVWIDALSNYITALGFGSDDESNLQKFWPGSVHVIGKDILWFHAVYWPAMLIAAGLVPPRHVVAHGWFMADGLKQSKTLGNFVGLDKLREKISAFSLDALRYFLIRCAPFGSDPDYNDNDFNKAFNELANVVGNGLNRTVKMLGRYRRGVLPPVGDLEDIDRQLIALSDSLLDKLHNAYTHFELQQVALLPVELARATNGYIDATAPFMLAKDPEKAGRLDTVLNLALQAISRVLIALLPVLPEKAADGLDQLNMDWKGKTLQTLWRTPLATGHQVGEGKPLFPKVG